MKKLPELGCIEVLGITCKTEPFTDLNEFEKHVSEHFKVEREQALKNKLRKYRMPYDNFKLFCVLCDATFTYLNGIIMHFKSKHTEDKNFECKNYCTVLDDEVNTMLDPCTQNFENSQKLVAHLREHLESVKNRLHFKCSECEKLFTDHKKLTRHKRQQHMKPPKPPREYGKPRKPKIDESGKNNLKLNIRIKEKNRHK